jgi:hypothetical protein
VLKIFDFQCFLHCQYVELVDFTTLSGDGAGVQQTVLIWRNLLGIVIISNNIRKTLSFSCGWFEGRLVLFWRSVTESRSEAMTELEKVV